MHNYQMTNLKQINAAVRWQTYGLDKNSCVSIKFVCAWLCVCAYYNGPIIFDRLYHPSLYNFPFLSLIIYARNQLFSVGNFPRIFFFLFFSCFLFVGNLHMTHRMARRIAPFRYFILQHRARHFGVSCRLVVSSLFFVDQFPVYES